MNDQILETILNQLGNRIGQLNVDLAISRTETAKLAKDLEELQQENEHLRRELSKHENCEVANHE